MAFKWLRLEYDPSYPLTEERKMAKDAGVDEFIEIEGYAAEDILRIQPDAISVSAGYLPRNVIMGLKNCRAILRLGNGYDKIDVAAATEKGIVVANLPDFCVYELAEHSMALMLSAARRLNQFERSMYNRTYYQLKHELHLHRIHGSTLGLIGFGKSAKQVALYANAMGMRVLDYHRNVNPEVEAQYNVTPVDLDTLLKESDYVMILCSLNDETRGIIGERELRLMKNTAVLINAARGAICDEIALIRALKEKWIAYAAIDVYEHFNIFKKWDGELPCKYFGLENVLLTPHIGANSVEAGMDARKSIAEQMKKIVSYILPTNCINPEAAEKSKLWRKAMNKEQL